MGSLQNWDWPTRDLAARGESPAAFGRRGIPPRGVARRSNTPGILPPPALRDGFLDGLGATRDFHHGLLGMGREKRSGSHAMRGYDIRPERYERPEHQEITKRTNFDTDND